MFMEETITGKDKVQFRIELILALILTGLACAAGFSNLLSRKFLLCTLICALMILGHPNTTFMMCLCIMAVFFIFVLIQRTTFLNFIYVGLTR